MLEEYFWKSSLTNRFSSAVETKLGQDIKRIKSIIENKRPHYDAEFKVTISKEELKEYWFNAGESVCKAILCLFSSFGPKSFNTNTDVILDNSWLVRANSKNYHHFFPQSFLKKQGLEVKKPWKEVK